MTKGMRNLLLILLLWPLLAMARDNRENDHAQWNADIAAFQAGDLAHPPGPGAVLFIGSSSIRFWTPTLAGDFPGVPVIDRGFGGSAIADSTYYADRIAVPCTHAGLRGAFFAASSDASTIAQAQSDDGQVSR